jgi:Leucine-rich repeat (LRR) protein
MVRKLLLLTLAVTLAGQSSGWSRSAPALYLKVFEYTPGRLADRPMGFVPTDPKRALPKAEGLAYVRVIGDLPLFSAERLAEVAVGRGLMGFDFSQQPSFGERDLSELAGLTTLRYLSLEGRGLTSASMRIIAGFKDLEVLRLGDGLRDKDIAPLAGLSKLRELSLGNAEVSGKDLTFLSSLRHLEVLDTSQTDAGDDLVPLLKKLPLRRLALGKQVTARGIAGIASLSSLEQLDLSRSAVTDLSSLKQLKRLHTLLAPASMAKVDLMELAEFPALRRLDVSGVKINRAALTVLATLPKLEELALSRSSVSDEDLSALEGLKRLKALEISDAEVSPAGMSALGRLHHLEVLSLSWNGTARGRDLLPLGALKKLRLLIVNGYVVPSEDIARLRRHLKEAAPRESESREDSDEFIASVPPSHPQPFLIARSGMHRLDAGVASAVEPREQKLPIAFHGG